MLNLIELDLSLPVEQGFRGVESRLRGGRQEASFLRTRPLEVSISQPQRHSLLFCFFLPVPVAPLCGQPPALEFPAPQACRTQQASASFPSLLSPLWQDCPCSKAISESQGSGRIFPVLASAPPSCFVSTQFQDRTSKASSRTLAWEVSEASASSLQRPQLSGPSCPSPPRPVGTAQSLAVAPSRSRKRQSQLQMPLYQLGAEPWGPQEQQCGEPDCPGLDPCPSVCYLHGTDLLLPLSRAQCPLLLKSLLHKVGVKVE